MFGPQAVVVEVGTFHAGSAIPVEHPKRCEVERVFRPQAARQLDHFVRQTMIIVACCVRFGFTIA